MRGTYKFHNMEFVTSKRCSNSFLRVFLKFRSVIYANNVNFGATYYRHINFSATSSIEMVDLGYFSPPYSRPFITVKDMNQN